MAIACDGGGPSSVSRKSARHLLPQVGEVKASPLPLAGEDVSASEQVREGFMAAWRMGGKVEGLFLSRLHASMLESVWFGVFGAGPVQKTQRFWPAMQTLATSPGRGAQGLWRPAPFWAWTAETRAWTVVSRGPASGSRDPSVLPWRSAGAGRVSGSI